MLSAFKFNRFYFGWTVVLFVIEVGIALFVKDRFVRPYVGDFLVVILMYCFVRSFWNIQALKLGLFVLLFAFAVEIGQHFQLVRLLGLEHSKTAKVIIGTGFDWADMLAYILGVSLVLFLEKRFGVKGLN